jgi:broad specificity phosphatase PhoE
MRLILVRHGESEGNVRGVFQGALPFNLTEKGKEQARKVALRLKEESLDAIFSSDNPRARQTADEIAKSRPSTPIHYSEDIRERDFGTMSGKPKPEYYKLRDSSGLPEHLYKPDGAETLQDVQDRMVRFYNKLLKEYRGKNVLVVSHGGCIRTLLAYLLEKGIPEQTVVQNASVTVVEVDEKSHRVSLVGCIKHLE